MREQSYLLVTALPEERAAVERALRRRSWRRSSERWRAGDGSLLALVCAGPGADAASRCTREALEAASEPWTALVGVGLCGALSPSLDAGSLILGELLARVGSCAADGELRTPLTGPPDLSGLLVTASAVVNAADDRQRLWESFDSPVRAGVDLESHAWASAALEHDVPWAVVRGVSDDAASPLPQAVLDAVDTSGGVDRAKVVRGVLRQPRQIPSLLRLGRRARQAADRAADFAVAWIERGLEPWP